MAISADETSEPARLAGECAVARDALTLARWVGEQRRQVTASKVLRKADIEEAGALLGVEVPSRVRSMADIRELSRPWRFAAGAGLLSVGKGWASAGSSLGSWPPGGADLLESWLAGLRAVCAAESYPQDSGSVQLLVYVLLTVASEGSSQGWMEYERMLAALDALTELAELGAAASDARRASERYYDRATERPLTGLITMLAGFGVISGDSRAPQLTALGRWAMERLASDLALPVPAGLSAEKVIAEAAKHATWDERRLVARDWLAARDPAAAARALLTAGEEMRPFARTVAVGLTRALGAAAYPAWRAAVSWPRTSPHAREMTDGHLSGRDWNWLVVEHAAAALEEFGPDRALTQLWLGMSGDSLTGKLAAAQAAGHPDGLGLLHALEQFTKSGLRRSIDQVAVVKARQAGVRPPLWRRVQVPLVEPLGALHEVIGVLFGADGEQAYAFGVAAKRYGPEDTADQDTAAACDITIQDAFAAGGGRVSYAVAGAQYWLTLEKTAAREPGAEYPVCVAFKGDRPFDLKAANRRLANLGAVGV